MTSDDRRAVRPRGRGRRRALAAGAAWIAIPLLAIGCASPGLSTPSLAPERLREDVGAERFDRWEDLAPELARGAVGVLVLDDGSIERVELDAVARACQDHGIVLAGVNLSLQALAYPVLRRYRSPVVRTAVAQEVYGPDEPRGEEELLSVIWAPNGNTGSTSMHATGWGRDGTPGVGHNDLYDVAQRLETALGNREMQGWPMAWERGAEAPR